MNGGLINKRAGMRWLCATAFPLFYWFVCIKMSCILVHNVARYDHARDGGLH